MNAITQFTWNDIINYGIERREKGGGGLGGNAMRHIWLRKRILEDDVCYSKWCTGYFLTNALNLNSFINIMSIEKYCFAGDGLSLGLRFVWLNWGYAWSNVLYWGWV